MDCARLLLDYIKTLIWPVILITVLFSYEDDVLELLKSREIDAFGLKIGQRIDDISRNYETEIAELKESLQANSNNAELISKIESIDRSIQKELSLVKEQSQSAAPVAEQALSRSAGAAKHERLAFEAVLNRDTTEAIVQFTQARQIWPQYHNVSELEKLLRSKQRALNNPEAWKQLYQQILTRYSWGMPSDIRDQFKQAI